MGFKTLVRYANADGVISYGDLGNVPATGDVKDLDVAVLDGDLESGFKASGKTDKIHKVEMLFLSCRMYD
jgi:hypothetical protein